MRKAAIVFLALGVLACTFPAVARDPRVLQIGEHLRGQVLESPHPYPGSPDGRLDVVWTDYFEYPGAAYVVFEFEEFDLAPGDRVEVADGRGNHVQVFTGKGYLDKGGDFITKAVPGSSAMITLYSKHRKPRHFGYRVDRVSRGFSDAELEAFYGKGNSPLAVCGTDDKKDARCYETSYPDAYQRSKAVARIVMDGSALCTAWLVSCENHIITNNHCTWDDSDFDTQGELDRMEFQFNYQRPSCGSGTAAVEHSFMGGTWLEHEKNLDYTLVKAPVSENPAGTYGYLMLDYRLADVGELMYVVGHPSGKPKEISLESTASQDGGFCKVYSQNESACIGGSLGEIGYYCDTEGGSSGSPVLSRTTNKVIALHHCGTCPNRGLRIQNIWDNNQAGAHPLPMCTINSGMGAVELNGTAYSCAGSIGIKVTDGSLVGTGTASATIWSGSETTPEALTLNETPPNSGTFLGSIGASGAAPAHGDGLLAIATGDAITVQYIDADDGSGGTNLVRTDAAQADCSGPVITNVQAPVVTANAATVTWFTSEAANGRLTYGSSLPPGTNQDDLTTFSTGHSLQVTGLIPCTRYYFSVTSADALGNTTTDDDGSAFYSFKTRAGSFAFGPDTVEEGAGAWTTAGAATPWHVSTCRAHSGTHAWKAGATACPGAYGTSVDLTLTSPIIALGGAGHGAHLKYWEWYQTADSRDRCYPRISPDGGTTWYVLGSFYSGSSGGWLQKDFDLASYTGSVRIQFRFTSDTSGVGEGWYVDDIEVSNTAPCVPDETGGTADTALVWSAAGKTVVSWGANPDAATYRLYRGVPGDLARLLDAGNDSCTRYEGAAVSASGLTEQPAAGSFYWYLVAGVNSLNQEGSAGDATSGPRIVNSTGGCL